MHLLKSFSKQIKLLLNVLFGHILRHIPLYKYLYSGSFSQFKTHLFLSFIYLFISIGQYGISVHLYCPDNVI